MKKLLSALLIATLLIASVACVFAVAEEEEGDTNPVVYNFLAALEDADTEDYTIVNNADGSVSITFKKAASDTKLADFTDATIDLNNQLYVAIDFVTEGADVDFYFNYTRADKDPAVAQLYWSGANGVTASVVSSTATSLVWDLNSYITGAKLFENKQHALKDFSFTIAAEGQTVIFNTLAIVNDKDAMTVGTPLVPKASEGDDTTTEGGDDTTTEGGDDTTTEGGDDTTTEGGDDTTTSSDAPKTGDTGIIVFAVLAVLAIAGSAVVVRARV